MRAPLTRNRKFDYGLFCQCETGIISSNWGTIFADFSLFHGEKRGQLFFA